MGNIYNRNVQGRYVEDIVSESIVGYVSGLPVTAKEKHTISVTHSTSLNISVTLLPVVLEAINIIGTNIVTLEESPHGEMCISVNGDGYMLVVVLPVNFGLSGEHEICTSPNLVLTRNEYLEYVSLFSKKKWGLPLSWVRTQSIQKFKENHTGKEIYQTRMPHLEEFFELISVVFYALPNAGLKAAKLLSSIAK